MCCPLHFHTILLLTQCHYFSFLDSHCCPSCFFSKDTPDTQTHSLWVPPHHRTPPQHQNGTAYPSRIHGSADNTMQLCWSYAAFLVITASGRMSAAFVSAVFYLYKYKISVTFCNDVDLAHTAAEIILQDLIPCVFKYSPAIFSYAVPTARLFTFSVLSPPFLYYFILHFQCIKNKIWSK